MSRLTKEDAEGFKRCFFVNLPVEYLEAVINEDESILHEARQWGGATQWYEMRFQ